MSWQTGASREPAAYRRICIGESPWVVTFDEQEWSRSRERGHRFFQRALTMLKVTPTEVVTDAAPIYPAVLEDLLPAAWHPMSRDMPTIRSRPITASSNTGSDRCAGSERRGPRR